MSIGKFFKRSGMEKKSVTKKIDNTLDLGPRLTVTDSILGYKAAYLCQDMKVGDFYFSSKQFLGSYGVDSIATCGANREHKSIGLECPCGFYMFKEKSDAIKTMRAYFVNAVLDVEAYGDIVEHQYGYRAREQVVLGVSMGKFCAWCKDLASVLVTLKAWRGWGPYTLQPACSTCAKKFNYVYTLSDVKNNLGTDVTFCITEAF